MSSNGSNTTNAKIDDIIQLLEEGERRLNQQNKTEAGVLILGDPGSDKIIFSQWISDNGNNLRSIRDPSDPEQYTVIDTAQTNNSRPIFDTMFPQLLTNKQNIAFYYFPSSDHSLGVAHDIALTYFIKKVVQTVKRVRMVYLLNHASLLKGAPWEDIRNLMATNIPLVKNFDKFKSSTVLVLTKVRAVNITYEQIINSTLNLLRIAREHLVNEANTRNIKSNSRSIQFLDIILRKSGNVYPYIQLSMSPDKAQHHLDEIPALRNSKINITKAIGQLHYAQTDETDFEYFVPMLSLDNVRTLLDEIYQRIAAGINTFSDQVYNYLLNKESQLHDIQQLRNETSSAYDKLTELQAIANQQNETETCIRIVFNSTSLPTNGTTQEGFLNAMKYATYPAFLYSVSGYPVDNSLKCGNALNNIIEYSDKSRKWYKFLEDLYSNTLSSYEVQKNTTASLCNDLTEFVIKTRDQNENKSSDELEPFVQKCDPENDYDFKGTIMNKPKLNTLYNLLNLTMNHQVGISCNSSHLLIKGQFVKISDINEYEKQCPASPQFIQVLAVHKLFFDKDFDKIGEIRLFVLAETWDIRGVRKINLYGEPGKPPAAPQAASGQAIGQEGEKGKPGLPGSPAGHFFGLGGSFISDSPLITYSIGGEGGPGQHGGDGAQGAKGEDAKNDLNGLDPFPKTSPGHEILFRNATNETCEESRPCKEIYVLQGQVGKPGGDGGDGGFGGLGGLPGTVTFVPVFYGADADFIGEPMNGRQGLGGQGGVGGKGGLYGKSLEVHIQNPTNTTPMSIDVKQLNESLEEGPRGSIGFPNMNANGTEEPREGKPLENEIKKNTVMEFRAYLRENMHQNIRESTFKEFHDSFNDDGESIFTTTLNPFTRTTPGNGTTSTESGTSISSSSDSSRTTDYNCTPIPTSEPKVNTANNLNSPINTAVNLIAGFFMPLKFIYPTLLTKYNLFETGIRSMFKDSASSQSSADSIVTKIDKFGINETITLADFLIRCVTKVKPYNNTEVITDVSEMRSVTLYIITELQIVLSHLMRKLNLQDQSLEFDPVSLMSKVDEYLINRKYKHLAKILFQSIDNNFLMNYADFENNIQPKIEQILEIQSERSASVSIKETKPRTEFVM